MKGERFFENGDLCRHTVCDKSVCKLFAAALCGNCLLLRFLSVATADFIGGRRFVFADDSD